MTLFVSHLSLSLATIAVTSLNSESVFGKMAAIFLYLIGELISRNHMPCLHKMQINRMKELTTNKN